MRGKVNASLPQFTYITSCSSLALISLVENIKGLAASQIRQLRRFFSAGPSELDSSAGWISVMARRRILTWHVHGSYLYYLAQAPHDFYLPMKPDRTDGYFGRYGNFPWPDNVVEVPAEEVRDLDIDCVLYQSPKHYAVDRFEILSEAQRGLPAIYLEHDPPREHPTDTRHHVDDSNVSIVHVTDFNNVMWDSGRSPTRVIEHGVMIPDGVRYTGELARGIVVVNNLGRRGRRLGADIFERVRREIPLDLIGINSEEMGGLGDVPHFRLAEFSAPYRFFFNPIRYTSLGLAVCEAMMLGMPVIGLATTEMATAIDNGVSGYVETDVDKLIERMQQLLDDPVEARRLGDGARKRAEARFNIERFSRDWDVLINDVTQPEEPHLAAKSSTGSYA